MQEKASLMPELVAQRHRVTRRQECESRNVQSVLKIGVKSMVQSEILGSWKIVLAEKRSRKAKMPRNGRIEGSWRT
jgi:hypothetical protein